MKQQINSILQTQKHQKYTEQQALSVLKKYFNYSTFRKGQLEIITKILEKKDCLAILPTGGGKSICFQIPGLLFKGTTIVISPLISLMKDQVDTLNSKGIPACYISSLLSKSEMQSTYELLKIQKYSFVYIAPERLATQKFKNVLSSIPINLIVIDEAHCISQWGDNFRPSYKKIASEISSMKIIPPIVAFTATAHPEVQSDICKTLQLRNPFIYYKSFKRTNLTIEVVNCHNRTIKNLLLLRLLKKHAGQVGIIYCATRTSTEELAQYLTEFGHPNEYYHGGLENKQKQEMQSAFVSGHTKLIVATNAFGMGIDVSNIRFVVHYEIPANIENYFQEIGRAGRDQMPSWCYTLYCKSDSEIQYELLKLYPNKIKEFEIIKKMMENKKCRSQAVLSYFGEKSEQCLNCDICNKTNHSSQLQIFISIQEIKVVRNFLETRKKYAQIHRQFPLTDTIIAFLSIYQPKNKDDFLKIPGIGAGFLNTWYNILQPLSLY